MPQGKLFFIKSKVNGLVLDIQGGGCEPGSPVVTWHRKEADNENQIWYEEHITGTIRSRLNNDMCLEINDDNCLVVNKFEEDNANQQWLTSGNRVMNRLDNKKVLDLVKSNEGEEGEEPEWAPGAKVCAWEYHGGENQQWELEYLPCRYFYIRSKMHGKVLDVKGADSSPGAKVIIWEQKPKMEDNQLWYEDKHGVILSKLNDCVIDASGKKTIRLAKFQPGDIDQLWTIYEDRIVSRVNPERVLDIKHKEHKNGAKLITHDWNGGDNQRWAIEYIN